jgi:ABC-2 type transport system ATP-binding protein
MHDPQVLLLDEPASGLDPQARIHMRELLRRLADGGKTLLVSSHILPELAAICDSIGIIHQGRLRAAGPINKVLGELRRDRVMELKAAGGTEQAARLIAQDGRCAKLDRTDVASGLLRFRFRGDDAELADLLKAVMDHRVRVATLREVPLSLEDAYMAISGISSEVPEEAPPEASDHAVPPTEGRRP